MQKLSAEARGQRRTGFAAGSDEGRTEAEGGGGKSRILTGILYEGTPCEAGNALFETVYPVYLMAGAFNSNSLEEMTPGNVYWKNHDLKQIVSLVTRQEKGIFCFSERR